MAVGTGGVIHVNVNCTDLERSMAFYRDELGLQPLVRTTPVDPQDGAAFGLSRAKWDAWMMAGPSGFRAPVIDLLQWIDPEPAAPAEGGTGFRCLHLGSGEEAVRMITDPDGTELRLAPGSPGLLGVTIGCADPDRSRRFYEHVVDVGGFVRLEEASGGPPKAANTVGIWRMALATDDIDADVAWLRRTGVPCGSDPVEMDMGPGIPALRFVLFFDPDGTALELIQRPGT